MSFKYLPSLDALFNQNRKYAPRSSSGKFVTIYPADDDEFIDLLYELDRRLGDADGPYILSDVQFGHGPVYFRYGAFRVTVQGVAGI
ncbi:MAG: hypothetical protein LBG11_04725, partial [Bifidobacteriaceae bacterium]|nr:hypothetical protein [Bifidobacteriaceae bacterium]